MELALESWYVVDGVEFDGTVLRVRMVPDHYNPELVNPVLELTIQEPADDAAARSSIAKFKDHFVVNVQLSPTVVELWGEFDDVPTIVAGRLVSSARFPYSKDDLVKIALSLEAQVRHWQAANAKLRAAVREVESYAMELSRRAEAKMSLTTRGTAIQEAQIDVLQRLLKKFSELASPRGDKQ